METFSWPVIYADFQSADLVTSMRGRMDINAAHNAKASTRGTKV